MHWLESLWHHLFQEEGKKKRLKLGNWHHKSENYIYFVAGLKNKSMREGKNGEGKKKGKEKIRVKRVFQEVGK